MTRDKKDRNGFAKKSKAGHTRSAGNIIGDVGQKNFDHGSDRG